MNEQTAQLTIHQAAARLAIVQSAAKILWRSVAVISATELAVMLLLQASGEPFTLWTALVVTLVLTAIALPVLNYIILRPVTQLAAQHAAATAESRFQSIAQAAQDGIVISSWDRKIRFANQAAEKMFGFPAGMLEGRELDELMPPEYVARCREEVAGYRAEGEAHIAGKGVAELEGQRQGGERFPIELSLNELTLADEKSFVAIIRDITERKRAEEALRASEKRLREVLRDLPIAVRVIHEGRLLFVNPADAHLHGYTDVREELAFGDAFAQITPEDREQVQGNYRRRTTGEDVPGEYEVRRLRRDGSSFPAKIQATRIVYDGKPASLAVIQDVTERHRLQMYERILPVCCVCGKIRDDQGVAQGEGEWEGLERYVTRHSDTQFSHTFCPGCLVEYRRREGLN